MCLLISNFLYVYSTAHSLQLSASITNPYSKDSKKKTFYAKKLKLYFGEKNTNLTKNYDSQLKLRNLSFQANELLWQPNNFAKNSLLFK